MNTTYFLIIFFVTIVSFVYKNRLPKQEDGITRDDTTALKGLAFFMVFFSHIGYFLFPDSNFLFPLSIFAGIGGNLFLFLSGYGLTKSFKDTNPLVFYKRRFFKLYIPLIITTLFIIILDGISGAPLSWQHILPGITAIVPSANIYTDFNSPLWFLTLLFIFYIIFPLVFRKEKPLRSGALLLLFGLVVPGYLTQFLPLSDGVIHLYAIHALAFPCGVIFALTSPRLYSKFRWSALPTVSRFIVWGGATILFIYISFHAAINTPYEQVVSLAATFLCIFSFVLFPLRSKYIDVVGVYSYELYLLHWPLLYRHDIFFRIFPAWFATYAYIFLLLGLSMGIAKLSNKIILRIKKPLLT